MIRFLDNLPFFVSEYSVDFVEGTVTEVDFKKNVLRNLFSEDENNKVDEEIYVDEDDEAFWNEVFGY